MAWSPTPLSVYVKHAPEPSTNISKQPYDYDYLSLSFILLPFLPSLASFCGCKDGMHANSRLGVPAGHIYIDRGSNFWRCSRQFSRYVVRCEKKIQSLHQNTLLLAFASAAVLVHARFGMNPANVFAHHRLIAYTLTQFTALPPLSPL